MKIDMIKLRWVLLALYAIIVLGLLGTALTQTLGSPVWLGFFIGLGNEPVWTIVVSLATVVSQAVFVFCSGTFIKTPSPIVGKILGASELDGVAQTQQWLVTQNSRKDFLQLPEVYVSICELPDT